MAFTSQQNFLASIDGVTANELNRVMDRTLDNYDERKACIENTLEGTSFFEEYFTNYYNVNASIILNIPPSFRINYFIICCTNCHGYNLRYFSESTKPNLEVFDFADFNQLKGYSLRVPEDIKDKNHANIDGLLRMKFNGDFQNDFQCILYDLDILIEKTKLTDRERECLNYFRNGLTNVKIADILNVDEKSIRRSIDSAIKKVNKKAFELQWR